MADRADITPELCRQLLRYDPETGKLFWKPRPRDMFATQRHCSVWNARYAGKEAFTANSGGYRVGRIRNLQFKAHRVGWAIVHGEWPCPDHDVDHINGITDDNRICNLRSILHADNGRNIKRPHTNTSGHIGISWHKAARKWSAYLGDGESRQYLGLFDTMEEAVAARRSAQSDAGYHPNHGR